jgi:nitrate reductase assembly molybdenum cofactor insertion protein NarJ
MAFIGAGRLADARSVVARLEAYAATPTADETNAMMTARVGLPVARGLLAHGEQRYADVVAALWPVRESLALFGGSHAQRDAIQRTLLDALQRAGQHEAARDLLNQRLADRPDSRWAHARVSQLGGGR